MQTIGLFKPKPDVFVRHLRRGLGAKMGQSQRHSMPSNAKCRPHASYTICTEARYLRGLGPIYQESPPIIGVWAERSALGLVIGLRAVR